MKQRINRSFERSKILEDLQEKQENIREKRELDVMNQVYGKHHKKQVAQKKKEKEDSATAMFNKQKKMDAEQFFKNRLDAVKQVEKEKVQGL